MMLREALSSILIITMFAYASCTRNRGTAPNSVVASKTVTCHSDPTARPVVIEKVLTDQSGGKLAPGTRLCFARQGSDPANLPEVALFIGSHSGIPKPQKFLQLLVANLEAAGAAIDRKV